LRIDSHVCFSERHPPEHLKAILGRNRFEGAILVVDSFAPPFDPPPHILGIVVRAGDRIALDEYQKRPGFRGVCCSLEHGIPAGVEDLAAHGIPLDVEMRIADFPVLLRLAERLPSLRLAIDHLGRPEFHNGPTADWLRGMEAAARLPQVFCKVSGLLTEVERFPWSAAPLQPFVQHALAVFGPGRLMFGSEWPVRLPEVTWKESLAAFTQAIGARTMEVREQLLGETARLFYRI
jgi:predicted TIM-barrel fold metal-dependent hydrolase